MNIKCVQGEDSDFKANIMIWEGQEKKFKIIHKNFKQGKDKLVTVNREKEQIPVVIVEALTDTPKTYVIDVYYYDEAPLPWWAYTLIFVPVGIVALLVLVVLLVVGALLAMGVMAAISFIMAKLGKKK